MLSKERDSTHPLLSGLLNVLVCFKERANVECLTAPKVSVDGPVQGELQGAAVEAAMAAHVLVSFVLGVSGPRGISRDMMDR